jgi:signal transduction histidine kinase
MVRSDSTVIWVREVATFSRDCSADDRLRGILFDVTTRKLASVDADTAVETNPEGLAAVFGDITQRGIAQDPQSACEGQCSISRTGVSAAQNRERRRLADDLHDHVSQPLAVARMRLLAGMAEASVEGEYAAEALELLDTAIARTRGLMSRMSPPFLDDVGLRKALEWLAVDFEGRYALETTVTGEIDESVLSEEGRSTLYRTARELLHNVVKHACVNRAEVLLAQEGGFITLTVMDNGAGLSEEIEQLTLGNGFGLRSIKGRLPRLGGDFELASSPEGGTIATAKLPAREIPE